jgi:small ligand-binding sensory domain FIST
VPLGDTVQFAVRDAGTAAVDLTTSLARRRADAALLFTCNGRGTRLFDVAHHDARALAGALGSVPLGGMFAAGEFGPVGGVNFVHTFAAAAVLFRERNGPLTVAPPRMHDR